MTWDDCLALGATRLAAILGCPVTTAHSWIRRSGPPDWQKAIYLAVIAADAKRHNKMHHATDASRAVGKVRRKS
jgi:uncharacterized protein YjcR